jgi:hypothetical protein
MYLMQLPLTLFYNFGSEDIVIKLDKSARAVSKKYTFIGFYNSDRIIVSILMKETQRWIVLV